MDIASGSVKRRIRVAGVSAIASPAWSPDGAHIAFSGSAGGESDLYLLDLSSEQSRRLTDDPAAGRVEAAETVSRGRIPRDDVAAMLLAVLDEPATAGVTFELVSGDTPIPEAIASLR